MNRMQVNPVPLQVVPARAGEPQAAPVFVVHRVRSPRDGRVRHLSVHRSWCSRIPVACDLTGRTSGYVSKAVEEAEQEGAVCALFCRTCRGWSIT